MTSALAEQICKSDGTTFRSSSIPWRWRCSRTPKVPVKLPDWLQFLPFIWPGAKSPVEKGFLLWVSLYFTLLWVILPCLISCSSPGALVPLPWGAGDVPLPRLWKKQPNTLHWKCPTQHSQLRSQTFAEPLRWWEMFSGEGDQHGLVQQSRTHLFVRDSLTWKLSKTSDSTNPPGGLAVTKLAENTVSVKPGEDQKHFSGAGFYQALKWHLETWWSSQQLGKNAA